MALQGTLDTFALADVLHLLAATKKTGCLRLDGSRGTGSVWVDSGEVVGVEAAHAPHATEPSEAMFELLRFDGGSFLFEADARHPDPSVPTDVDSLLTTADTLLAEWREIEAVVPSLDSQASLARSIQGDTVTVSAGQWPALVALGGGTTVRALGEALGLGELPVSRAVRDLVELGVVELSAPSEPVAVEAPVFEAPAPTPVAPAVIDEPAPVAASIDLDQPAPPAPAPPTPLSQPSAPLAAPAEHALPPVAWTTDEPVAPPVPAGDPDELPVARPIKARKARSRTAESAPQPSRFVPLDLPGHMSPATASASASDEVDDDEAEDASGVIDDLAAAFPGLANRVADPEVDELSRQLASLSPNATEAIRAAAEAETDEEREAALDAAVEGEGGRINRGLLLKFLSSVKS